MRASTLFALSLLAACAGPSDGGDDSDTIPLETDGPVETDVFETGDTADLPEDTDPPEWPESPDAYPFETTYLHDLLIPGVDASTGPRCCRDWGEISRDAIENGTTRLDNAVARLAASLGFFVDLQGELDAQLEQGSFAILLDHHDLPAGDGDYDLAVFLGEFATGTTWYDAVAGDGEFWAWDSSFVGGSGRPSVHLAGATLVDDELVATGDRVDIPIPLSGVSLIVPARDVRITATLERDADGVWVKDGQLSAYVELDDFYDAYNDLADTACACANLPGPLFTRTASGWEANCADSAELLRNCGYYGVCPYLLGDSLFAAVPGFCGTIAPLVPTLADLDLDGDPADYEAFSVGIEIDGAPADVVGVVPAPF